jgi:uncharacterized protein YjbI with pentapeptide repeats
MANQEHLDILKQGVEVWNRWREEHPDVDPDLSRTDYIVGPLITIELRGANLSRTNLSKAVLAAQNLSGVNLANANLQRASLSMGKFHDVNLQGANLCNANCNGVSFSNVILSGANLSGINLNGAYLIQTNFEGVNLTHADLTEAYLYGAKFANADLSHADLRRARISGTDIDDIDYAKLDLSDWEEGGIYHEDANFSHSNLKGANLNKQNLSHVDFHNAALQDANLSETNLRGSNLCGADLRRANLTYASLVETKLKSAKISECLVYGISAWNVQLERTTQLNLVITPPNEPQITVDNLKIAQFIYLLLNNDEVRDVINTITTKTVLILGRFKEERKQVLDALREVLRNNHNLLPVVFDFDPSTKRDLTETITTLAHISRFIIADLTDAKSLPQELQAIVPNLPSVPVQPILHICDREYAMFEHFKRYPWVYGGPKSQDHFRVKIR